MLSLLLNRSNSSRESKCERHGAETNAQRQDKARTGAQESMSDVVVATTACTGGSTEAVRGCTSLATLCYIKNTTISLVYQYMQLMAEDAMSTCTYYVFHNKDYSHYIPRCEGSPHNVLQCIRTCTLF